MVLTMLLPIVVLISGVMETTATQPSVVNGVGGTYHPSGVTIKTNALLACESVYGTGKCSSNACGGCNDKGYHSIDIATPCNGATMWNYDNQESSLACGWTYCSEVIVSFDNKTWEPSCSNGAFDVKPTPSVCFDVKLTTNNDGGENSWSLGTCQSNETYASGNHYSEQCCLVPGVYNLTCMDSFGDGWNGGTIKIQGQTHCKNFTASILTKELTITGCSVGGNTGDNTQQGTCEEANQVCNVYGNCEGCNVGGNTGDSTQQGTCQEANLVCVADGTCADDDCLRVYEGVSSIPINNVVTIDRIYYGKSGGDDYYPGENHITDGGNDHYDGGNYIGVPAFTENYVTYLEYCAVGQVDGSSYSMAMNNSGISTLVFNNYQHSSISTDGQFGGVQNFTTGSYQFNQWIGFWKISYSFNLNDFDSDDDDEGIIHHLWVTNSPTAGHVSHGNPRVDVDLVNGLKGYHVVYNMWITNMTIATPDDVIKQLVRAVADALAPEETCEDGIQNQDETGIDCGGVCPACEKCFDQNQKSEICGMVDCSQPKAGLLCPGKCWSCKNYKGKNWCLKKKRAGECDQDWVNLRCRATCAKCCGNVYSTSTCAKFTYGVTGSRRCQSSTIVKNNCRRSCGLCG